MKYLFLFLLSTAPVIAQIQENTEGIQVQGTAQKQLPHDLAKFEITLKTFAGTAPEAQAVLDPGVQELELLLRNLPMVKSVEVLQLHVGQYNASATLGVICNSADVETLNLEFHKVDSKLIAFKPNPEIEPTILIGPKLFSSPEQHYRVKGELLERATNSAKAQAYILANTSHVQLGKLLSLKVLPEKITDSNSLNVTVEAKYAVNSD